MTKRMNTKEYWSRCDMVLTSGQVAEEGHTAAIEKSTGLVVVAATDPTLRPIGRFDEDLTGDGTKRVNITLFREVELHEFANDTVAPVVAASVGNDCFIKDSFTVSIDGTGRSVMGLVWKATATSVLVEVAR